MGSQRLAAAIRELAGLAGLAGLAILALACGGPGPDEAPGAEAAPALAPGSASTDAGLYRVHLEPEGGAIPLSRLHGWIVSVRDAEGRPFEPARLAFSGGMPQHGHGLVTAPRVTRSLGAGRFLVEGVKFHMGGEWILRVELVGPGGPDVARFRVRVRG